MTPKENERRVELVFARFSRRLSKEELLELDSLWNKEQKELANKIANQSNDNVDIDEWAQNLANYVAEAND